MATKKVVLAKFNPDRQRLIIKNRSNTIYPEEFRDVPTWNKFKKIALDASDNGRCWWIYQYIINSQGKR